MKTYRIYYSANFPNEGRKFGQWIDVQSPADYMAALSGAKDYASVEHGATDFEFSGYHILVEDGSNARNCLYDVWFDQADNSRVAPKVRDFFIGFTRMSEGDQTNVIASNPGYFTDSHNINPEVFPTSTNLTEMEDVKTSAEGAPKFALTIVDLDANHMHAALGIPEDRRLVLTESLKETFAKLDEAAKGKEVNSVHFLNELLGEAENFNEATVLTYAYAINFEKRLRRKREGNGLAALLAAITE